MMGRTVGDLRLLTVLLALSVSACDNMARDVNGKGRRIPVPVKTGDGWDVASLDSVGMDPEDFIRLTDRLDQTSEHRIHGILVVRNSRLVFEKYYPGRKFNLGQYTGGTGYGRDDLHVLCSATKSVSSALLGIALDKDFIQSIEQRVHEFFPEHADVFLQEPAKGNLTIKHLLTMTSGLTYDDESLPYTNPNNDMYRFFTAGDPIRFLLAKPLFSEPGTVFDYDNCNTNIFGQIIRKAANKKLDVFAKEYLFDKIGVARQEWQPVRNDVVLCSGDLHLRPRDMAKFGQLFLNRGEWNGERIISSAWCDLSTAAFLNPNSYTAQFPWADGYGYHWWQRTFVRQAGNQAAYFAFGWGGQMIMIVPDLSLVIVTTAGNWFNAEKISPFSIVSDYIFPSLNR